MKEWATQTGSNDLLWNMPSSIWKAMWLNIRKWTLNITLYTPGISVPWCNTLCDITVIYKFITNERHYFAKLLGGVCWNMFTFYFSSSDVCGFFLNALQFWKHCTKKLSGLTPGKIVSRKWQDTCLTVLPKASRKNWSPSLIVQSLAMNNHLR
jgi:hypothetical protein